jgi:SAM-dependent methyltransferase
MTDKFTIQDRQYRFPYHHIPHLDDKGDVVCHRLLTWGFEYMCYLLHIRDLVSDLNPSSILDVGCGDGRLLGLEATGARKVGADLSERSIQFARAFHPGLDFRVADAAGLDETFDVVLAMEVLEHVPDDRVAGFLRALEARTRPGGHVVVSVPTVVLPLNPKHYRHYDLSLLKDQLDASGVELQVERVQYVYRHPWIMRMYRRVTLNRLWFFELHSLRRLMWRFTWNRLRFATERDGRHLVAVLRRSDPVAGDPRAR